MNDFSFNSQFGAMKRRRFIKGLSVGGAAALAKPNLIIPGVAAETES